jgi:23S rRNA pseudouridine955/2504/2580 synthase/23S rRNA pseudouridine1911/1915/1917 synthase
VDLETRKISSTVDQASSGKMLDEWLAGRFTYHPIEKWRELIADGQLLLNGHTPEAKAVLHNGDIVTYMPVNLQEPPVDFSYDIIYEDEHLLVINKSGDLPCHPAGPFFKHTLWHHLSTRLGQKVYIVNRLDRETSGLLIATKAPGTAGKLAKQSLRIEKEYRAIVFGSFNHDIHANGFLIKDPESIVRKKRRFVFDSELPENAKNPTPVETLLIPVKTVKQFSLVKAILKTGKLHQIRATLFSLGYPLAGDKLYGPDDRIYLKIRDNKITDDDWKKLIMKRQALHSYRIYFPHPITNKTLEFTAPIPEDFNKILT